MAKEEREILDRFDRIVDLIRRAYNYPVITHGRSNYIRIPVKYIESGLLNAKEDASVIWLNRAQLKDLLDNSNVLNEGALIIVPDKRKGVVAKHD